MTKLQLDVYLDIAGQPEPIGQAWFTQRRGGPVSTVFSYSSAYLAAPGPLPIDPGLPLVSGNQYVDGLPGAFQDSAPDRWGRNLIEKSSTQARELNEVDYLCEVSDRTRQGALRFTLPGEAIFIHPEDRVPKLIHLPRLLQASHSITDGVDDANAIKDLLDAGSASLGGARPKASVLGADGGLRIAKFPHRSDDWDVMAWECVALDLAELAGIATPAHDLVKVGDGQNVLILSRFDRTGQGHRIPYMSAMTALGAADGEWHDYVEVAEIITDIGSSTSLDLIELYRRVAFSIAIHNTDDHLRNHGFLASNGGWRPSPVFDINPNPNLKSSRVTGVSGATVLAEEQAGLVSFAEECRLDQDRAALIRLEVAKSVEKWSDAAAARGIAPSERERFAPLLNRGSARLSGL